jgi:hypothetical protein
MRSRPEPSQVTPAGFGSERIAVTQGGTRLLLHTSTGRGALVVRETGYTAKPVERREQSEPPIRGGHGVWARPVKTFRNAGDVREGTAGL